MLSRMASFTLCLALCACGMQGASTVPSGDRIPDSTAKIFSYQCARSPSKTMTKARQSAFCTCFVRELQRTMSNGELLAVGKVVQTASSSAARTEAVFGDPRIRHATTSCLNEAFGG